MDEFKESIGQERLDAESLLFQGSPQADILRGLYATITGIVQHAKSL